MLIDTHAHLYWEDYKSDFEGVIQRSLDAGVTTIINVGVDVELSKKAAKLESNKIKFYSTIGIHPHDSIHYSSDPDVSLPAGRHGIHEDIRRLEQIYQSNSGKIIAVGECGLDYFFDHPAQIPPPLSVEQIKDLQRKLFQAQIDLAKKLNLPLIVHCRDDRSQNPENSEAWDEVLKMVGNHPTILHCYSGLPKTTQKILNTPNLLVSFAATITYPKNEYLREAAKLLPLEKIVLETDCPFLPPQSKRGQRNEPAYILDALQTIAQIKNLPLAKVESQIYQNTVQFFKLQV